MSTTNDPALRSFLPVADDSHFPIQNLPYGVFQRPGAEKPNVGVRIGDWVLDLKVLEHRGLFANTALGSQHVFCKQSLNKFMSMGPAVWTEVRGQISRWLRGADPTLRDDNALRDEALVPVDQVKMHLPAEIGDYTDFYSSREHATNVGVMFRGKDHALMPNWLWLPVGYHGRASSIVVSGTPVRRPCGQTKADDAAQPSFGPTRMLDFELEMGVFVGPGNALGAPIGVDEAWSHMFGLVLVNDWSARDIQRWEYQPLGPFLAKNFATSISPWVVTLEALAPFRTAGPPQDPTPLPYLRGGASGAPLGLRSTDTFHIQLEVSLQTPQMSAPQVISRTNLRHLYWSLAQQMAHHTITGCNLRPGDLLATGTISGPTPDSYGSLLELAWRGERPIRVTESEQRASLQDGDVLRMTGWCEGAGYRVGFGECTGQILPANAN